MKVLTPRPFGWWWAKYLRIALHPDDCSFGEMEELFFDPCRGFMCWTITRGMRGLYVTKVCGDGRYWRRRAYEMFAWAKERYGVKYLICCTRRNPDAFCRMFGGELWKTTDEDTERPLYWFRTKNTEVM